MNDYTIGYDADQLMQYFEDRNMNAEDFEARTKYYFQDQEYATRKEQQYTKFSNADNADLIAYAKGEEVNWVSDSIKEVLLWGNLKAI